jgi:hypothetical protein
MFENCEALERLRPRLVKGKYNRAIAPIAAI